MVQSTPQLPVTLEALGPSGAGLPTEMKTAMTHSLPITQSELALPGLAVWGRVHTLNGRDYVVAHATLQHAQKGAGVERELLYVFSQDGVKWLQLTPVGEEQRTLARKMRTLLQGDPQARHFWPPKAPGAEEEEADAEAEGATAAADAGREQLSELQRLRCMVDDIVDATALEPVGSAVVAADGAVVPNPLFTRLNFPDKLDSYYHRLQGPRGKTAADDVKGSWALQYDGFKQRAICRSLLYLGYSFFYDAAAGSWGGFYNGDGLKNADLIFML